jgi:UDP-glucuronate 4-epimerase
MHKRVLVTGVAGFIGSHLAEALMKRGDEVVGIDNFCDSYDPIHNRRNIALLEKKGYHPGVLEGDIRDGGFLDRVFAEHAFDAVIHLAALAGVRTSVQRPQIYADVNVTGTMNILERVRARGIGRLVFASSSSIYGNQPRVPFRETDVTNRPASPYAATKQAGELLCYTWHHLYGMNVSALRFFTVYGPRQRPDMAIHRFARMLVRGEPITMFGDGDSRRDYTYVSDIVQGVMAALDRCQGFDVFNIGSERVVPLKELIALLGRELQREVQIQEMPKELGDVPITSADVTKARERLGYSPQVSIEQGIRLFAQWYLSEGEA